MSQELDQTGTAAPVSGRAAVLCLGGHAGFAVAPALRLMGAEVLDREPPPKQISADLSQRYGFGVASVRTGPFASLRQMWQVLEQAEAGAVPDAAFWKQADGSFVDACRASVEPAGCDTLAAASGYRLHHLALLKSALEAAGTVVLVLSPAAVLENAKAGLVAPLPLVGVKAPKTMTPRRAAPNADETKADLLRLLAVLAKLSTGIRPVFVIEPQSAGLAAEAEARLRTVCAEVGLEGVAAGRAPVANRLVDDLLALVARNPATADAAGRVVAQIVPELGIVAGVVAAVAAEARPELSRKERRERRNKRERKPDYASSICEDELLEAFS